MEFRNRSDTFPQMIRGLVVDYDTFCELQSLHGHCIGIKDENQRVNGESQTIKSENQRLIAFNQRLREQNEESVPENQRLNEEVDNLRSKEDENESLKESHYQLVLGSIGGLGFVVLLILIMLIWCMKQRNICCFHGEDTVITPVGEEEHPEVLWDYRPRSRTIEELHHKFGMNEIDNVTAKEGCDLVRIARPLETSGAERRLSEELLDVQPTISDGNGQSIRTNDRSSVLETGMEGEGDRASREGDNRKDGERLRITELCETLGI